MMRALAALAALLTLGACAHAPAPAAEAPALQRSGDVAAGFRLAEANCSTCHAIGPTGESRHPMAPPFRTLSRDYPVNTLEEAFAEGILVGHPAMPQFSLSPRDIDDLLSYIQSVQERRAG
ncbi:MAG: cytochrome c [Hyphomonadaceae bacterium]|nr:cytochrome c [Hyphomonadaceae bacterium]